MNSWLSLPERALSPLTDWGLLGLRLWAGQEFLLAGYTKEQLKALPEVRTER